MAESFENKIIRTYNFAQFDPVFRSEVHLIFDEGENVFPKWWEPGSRLKKKIIALAFEGWFVGKYGKSFEL